MMPPEGLRDYFKGDRERMLESVDRSTRRQRFFVALASFVTGNALWFGLFALSDEGMDVAAWIMIGIVDLLLLWFLVMLVLYPRALVEWMHSGIPPEDE